MMNYNVLWFDDEHEALPLIKDQARRNNVILFGFADAKTGVEYLKKNLATIDAVVLDGIFYKEPGLLGDARGDDAISYVQMELVKLEAEKKLPKFILSGQPSYTQGGNKIAEIFNESKVYNKIPLEDVQNLWDLLKQECDKQPETQIKQRFGRAFEVCDEKYLRPDATNLLLTVIKQMEDLNIYKEPDPFNLVRHVVERIFNALNRIGVIPDTVLNGKGSITNCSKFINNSLPGFELEEGFVPKIIGYLIHRILDITQDGSHDTGNLKLEVNLFTSHAKTSYTYTATVFQLLEVLVWFKQFVDENQDVELNASKWKEVNEYYEGVIEKDALGNYHCGEYALNTGYVDSTCAIGDKIKITGVAKNTNRNTSEMYPHYGVRFVKV